MQTSKPTVGSWIRVTEVIGGGSINLNAGDIIRVASVSSAFDQFPIPSVAWVVAESDSNEPRFGLVKWEPVDNIPACWDALKTAGHDNRRESLDTNIRNLIGALETERIRVRARLAELHQANARIAALEKELLRVQAPPGTPFVWTSDGPKPQGWTCPPLPTQPEPEKEEPQTQEDNLRARCGRQRRELRRINQRHRLVILERDNAARALDDALEALVNERRSRRLAESINDTE